MKRALTLVGLAFRNLARHRRRTVITALSLAIGLALFVLFDSLLAGLENDGVRSMVWYDTGGLQVQNKEYWNDRDLLPLDKSIDRPRELLDLLAAKGYAATPRAVFAAEMVINKDPWPQDGSLNVRCVAIDPERDGTVFKLRECLAKGEWLKPGQEGVLIGAQMATDLGADIGYPITVVARTYDGAFQTMDLPVVGILNTPNAFVNRRELLLPLDAVDAYLELGGRVNQVAVALGEDADAAGAAAGLGAALAAVDPNLAVLPWRVTGADFLAFVQSRQGLGGLILILVFIVAFVGVFNTMLLTMLERRREIGMLRALGMQDGEVVASLLLEAGFIGLLGAALGLALSLPFNLALVGQGLDLSGALVQINASLPYSGHLRGAWHPQVMAVAVLASVASSVAAAVVPVLWALFRQAITECLRQN